MHLFSAIIDWNQISFPPSPYRVAGALFDYFTTGLWVLIGITCIWAITLISITIITTIITSTITIITITIITILYPWSLGADWYYLHLGNNPDKYSRHKENI